MEIQSRLLRIMISGIILATSPLSAHAATPVIMLSEIRISGNTADDDFVELYNADDDPIPLKGWHLCRRTKDNLSDCKPSNGSFKAFSAADIIQPKGFFLWVNSKGKMCVDSTDVKTAGSLTDNNSLALLDSTDTIIDSVAWGSGHAASLSSTASQPNPPKSYSLIRDKKTYTWSLTNTPTPTSSHGIICSEKEYDPAPLPVPVSTPAIKTVRLNEVLPDPPAKDATGEFIELYNFGKEPADISGWILRDASKTGKYTFPSATIIAAMSYLTMTGTSLKLPLNNSDETVSLYDATNALIDSVQYETSKENVSLNYMSTGWRSGIPTPGMPNILNNLPMTKEKVPKKGYRGMPVAMVAKGKDADRDELKYVWDFGDGHKSYKRETSHAYEESGDYTVTLKISDGKDDVIETFTITIRKYEAPDIRIVSFVPNPDGNDSENEWILIENREKKHAVDLLGFGIATGWKKLANHPVRESFIIEPKSEARLTRAYSLFTLPNQKGKIELRAPDGSVIQDIKYKLEKSAPEDAVYTKKKGERWSLGPAQKKPAKAPLQTIIETSTKTPKENLTSIESVEPEPIPNEDHPSEPEIETVPPMPPIIRSETITEDPTRPDFSDLLSYGLSLHLPEALAYAPSERILISPATEKPLGIGASDTFLVRINTLINAWLYEL